MDPQQKREWLRTFECLRKVLDQPDRDDGWLDSSTHFRAGAVLDRAILEPTAHCWCDDSCWARLTDEAKFHAILPDGTLIESFVRDGEQLGPARRRLPVRPRRVIHLACSGGPTGPAVEGYRETTVLTSYGLDQFGEVRPR